MLDKNSEDAQKVYNFLTFEGMKMDGSEELWVATLRDALDTLDTSDKPAYWDRYHCSSKL